MEANRFKAMPHSNSRQVTGEFGENLAAEYLVSQGYTILDRNCRSRYGEIDIVALQNNTVVLVEVRTRRGASTEQAFESIAKRKRERVVASAQHYIDQHRLHDDCWRVDIIAIALRSDGQHIIEHIEDALAW